MHKIVTNIKWCADIFFRDFVYTHLYLKKECNKNIALSAGAVEYADCTSAEG